MKIAIIIPAYQATDTLRKIIASLPEELAEGVGTFWFRSKARNCPFDGWSMRGRTLLTMVGGKVVHEETESLKDRITRG